MNGNELLEPQETEETEEIEVTELIRRIEVLEKNHSQIKKEIEVRNEATNKKFDSTSGLIQGLVHALDGVIDRVNDLSEGDD